MTFLRALPAHAEYSCNICGFVGIWSDETCPNEAPVACSDPCAAELKGRVDSGLFQLPKLRGYAGGFRIVKSRRGY